MPYPLVGMFVKAGLNLAGQADRCEVRAGGREAGNT